MCMSGENLHQTLQEASRKIKAASDAVIRAQGSDAQLIEQAESYLQAAEENLQQARKTSGSEATENPQFQQAYELLHDTRQQVSEAQQNNNEIL